MVTLKTKKIEIIESLRGFASVYIVIHHFLGFTGLKQKVPEVIHFPFRFGQEVVLLFFLMSGFVIYASNQSIEKIGFTNYFKKRFLRIYPIFLLSLLLSFIVLLINHQQLLHGDIINLIGNIFMLQDTGNKPGIIFDPFLQNYPLWSLSYEWWFYMLFFPLMIYFHRSKMNSKFPNIYSILLISSISWLLYLVFPNHLLLVFSHLIIWWSGVYIAQLYFSPNGITFKTLRPVYVSLIVITLLSTIPAIEFLLYSKAKMDFNSYPIIDLRHFSFTLLIIFIGNVIYSFKNNKLSVLIRPMTIFAPISYAIYCVHFPILLLRIEFIKNEYLSFLLKFVIILLIASLFELVIQPLFYNRSKRIKIHPVRV